MRALPVVLARNAALRKRFFPARASVAERALLDRRSDDLARSFLAPLPPSRRERLVAAMAEVELLLTSGLVELKVVDPAERDAEWCLNEYFGELGRRFETGFEPA